MDFLQGYYQHNNLKFNSQSNVIIPPAKKKERSLSLNCDTKNVKLNIMPDNFSEKKSLREFFTFTDYKSDWRFWFCGFSVVSRQSRNKVCRKKIKGVNRGAVILDWFAGLGGRIFGLV